MLFVSDYDWNIDLLLWTVLAIYFRFIVSIFPWSFVFLALNIFHGIAMKICKQSSLTKICFYQLKLSFFLPLTVNSTRTYIFTEYHSMKSI